MQEFCLDHERRMVGLRREFDECKNKYEGVCRAVKELENQVDRMRAELLNFELITRRGEEIIRLHHEYHGVYSKLQTMKDYKDRSKEELVKLSQVMNEEKAKFDVGYKDWVQKLL